MKRKYMILLILEIGDKIGFFVICGYANNVTIYAKTNRQITQHVGYHLNRYCCAL